MLYYNGKGGKQMSRVGVPSGMSKVVSRGGN